MLELTEIKRIIEAGRPGWIEKAESDYIKLQVHVNGVGTANYLKQVEGLENDRQISLRKKFTMSNRFVSSNLLRPVDKVFNANGGSRMLNMSGETSEKALKEKLNNVVGGLSVRKYIENIQANKYYSDPAGLVFFEWKDKETKPTQKIITSIFNYKQNGRSVDWVIFKPQERFTFKDDKNVKIDGLFYRVVDDKYDYLIHYKGDSISIVQDETFKNPWGYVPAIINSDKISPSLEYMESPIWDAIDLLDGYLTMSSTKSIYQFLHGYPIFWAYVQPCRACDGTGLYEGVTCNVCGGDGHTFQKDVSDIIKLKPPTSKEDPMIAPDIAGYVQPDLDTWKEQRIELDWLWSLMHFTIWGTARQEKADNETATAAFIDSQPVNDRLNKFTDSFEKLESMMIDIIGKFYSGSAYKSNSTNYGRRFLVEPPDVIWAKYLKAKTDGAPKVSLDYLLTQFYQSEFANDVQSLIIAQKGVKLEPFVHKTDDEINKLSISAADKLRKFYFNEWFKTIDQDELLIKDVDALIKEFDAYMKDIVVVTDNTNETRSDDTDDQNDTSDD